MVNKRLVNKISCGLCAFGGRFEMVCPLFPCLQNMSCKTCFIVLAHRTWKSLLTVACLGLALQVFFPQHTIPGI